MEDEEIPLRRDGREMPHVGKKEIAASPGPSFLMAFLFHMTASKVCGTRKEEIQVTAGRGVEIFSFLFIRDLGHHPSRTCDLFYWRARAHVTHLFQEK